MFLISHDLTNNLGSGKIKTKSLVANIGEKLWRPQLPPSMEQERVGKRYYQYKNNVSAWSQLVHKTGGAYPSLSNINQLLVGVFQSTMYCTLNGMSAITGLPLFCKHIRQLPHWILELLTKNLFFGQFGNFQPGYGPHELQSTYSKMHFQHFFPLASCFTIFLLGHT